MPSSVCRSYGHLQYPAVFPEVDRVRAPCNAAGSLSRICAVIRSSFGVSQCSTELVDKHTWNLRLTACPTDWLPEWQAVPVGRIHSTTPPLQSASLTIWPSQTSQGAWANSAKSGVTLADCSNVFVLQVTDIWSRSRQKDRSCACSMRYSGELFWDAHLSCDMD